MSYAELGDACRLARGSGLTIVEEHDAVDLAVAFASAVTGVGVVCVLDASWTEQTKAAVREHALRWTANNAPSLTPSAAESPSAAEAVDGPSQSIFMMGLSSGTSGTPKAFTRSRESWETSLAASIEYFGVSSEDITLAPGPASSSMNLYALAECLMTGSAYVGLNEFSTRTALEALQANRVTRLVVVPTLLDMMVALAQSRGQMAPHLRSIVCAGSSLAPELAKRVQKWAPGAQIYSYYGASELGFVAASLFDAETNPHNSLQLFPGVELRIINPAGDTASTGEIGDIQVKSPYISNGYAWGDDRLAFAPVEKAPSWFTVRDVGMLHPNGGLHVVGRGSDMMQIAGNNVYPQEVEQTLNTVGAPYKVIVTAVSDRRRGQRIVACLLPDKNGVTFDPPMALKELRSLASRLNSSRKPAAYYELTEAPLSTSGKLSRKRLQHWIEENDARVNRLH